MPELVPPAARFLQGLITLDSKKHGQHNRTSLASYLFPNANLTRQARARLFNFRYWFLPTLRQRTQSNIYQYLVKRQARRAGQRYPFVVSNPEGRTPTFWRRKYVKHGLGLRKRAKMAYTGTTAASDYGELGVLRAEGREPGARRKKLAGYLKAANELRQSYFQQEGGTSTRDFGSDLSGVEGPGAFPEAATVRSGNEEMILFPSYARRHVKGKPRPRPQSEDMDEQEYWQREWDRHQDDNAIVDVEVRGWIYTPHRGQANRKQRLMIGLARQLSGLPAPPSQQDNTYSSQTSSAEPSPHRSSKRDEEIIAREAENIVRKGEQEQQFARRGAFSEEPMFDRDGESIYEYNSRGVSRDPSPARGRQDPKHKRTSQMSTASSVDGDADNVKPLQKRSTWSQPEKMTAAELTAANGHLMNRLRLFMANPLQSTPISCFFYNESCARQHTVETNASGHFTCRAPLDFVPTHVRVLASEKLAATEEVQITSPKGVSMISDIDDTIKHSAISSGAREIFRNAFIRELGDLTIDGVREWYNTMNDMGVQLHYVSNSPWQLYPVLASYFKLANLPGGSFHLKQYSGYLQGIFEPVAERKKSSLEKIMGDFPDRKFILVGDSGEADLEVYTDVALENPGRVLGIFIRDVTTVKTGYFDPSNSRPGSGKSSKNHSRNHSRQPSNDTLARSKRLSRPDDIREDDADLKAAIAASLADMEEETQRARRRINPDAPAWGEYTHGETHKSRPNLPPRRGTEVTITDSPRSIAAEEDLIDLSDDAPPLKQPWLTPPPSNNTVRKLSQNGTTQAKASPSPPPKPQALRSPSPTPSPSEPSARRESSSKPAPPRPRKPSSAVKPPSPAQIQTWTAKPPMPQPQTPAQQKPSPLSQVTQNSPETGKERPPLPARPKTYAALSKGLASAYNALPTTQWRGNEGAGQARNFPAAAGAAPSETSSLRTVSTMSTQSIDDLRSASAKKAAPPPPPARRRPMTSYNTTQNVRKSTNRLSGNGGGGGDDGSEGGGGGGGNLPGSPGEAGMSRKEFLWQQRWARAKSVLDRQGVTLRSWRAGIDVADICVKLVEQAQREIKREEEKQRYQSGSRK